LNNKIECYYNELREFDKIREGFADETAQQRITLLGARNRAIFSQIANIELGRS